MSCSESMVVTCSNSAMSCHSHMPKKVEITIILFRREACTKTVCSAYKYISLALVNLVMAIFLENDIIQENKPFISENCSEITPHRISE